MLSYVLGIPLFSHGWKRRIFVHTSLSAPIAQSGEHWSTGALDSHTKFERNPPSRLRDLENGCARAHVQMHSTSDMWKALI